MIRFGWLILFFASLGLSVSSASDGRDGYEFEKALLKCFNNPSDHTVPQSNFRSSGRAISVVPNASEHPPLRTFVTCENDNAYTLYQFLYQRAEETTNEGTLQSKTLRVGNEYRHFIFVW